MKILISSLALILLMFGCKNQTEESVTTQIAERAETTESVPVELEIVDFEGLKPLLHRSDDKVYVINFWATWCAPCVKELPYFEKLNETYADKHVEVILVSLDFPKQYEKKLKPFIEDRQLKSRVIALNDVDFNSWIGQVDESWSGAIPATVIYSKDKRKFYEASFEWEDLESELKTFL